MLLVLALLQEHAADSGPASPFEVNFGLFFWTWLVFIALFFALKRWAWPSLLKMVEERERKIEKQIQDAERANTEAQRLLDEHKKQIAAAHNQAQEILAKAKSVSEKERATLLAKAREEYDALLNRARKDIDAEKDKAIQALRREAVDLSIAAASRVIDESLGKAEKKK